MGFPLEIVEAFGPKRRERFDARTAHYVEDTVAAAARCLMNFRRNMRVHFAQGRSSPFYGFRTVPTLLSARSRSEDSSGRCLRFC